MLILKRFSHRHSRSFFVPNCKPCHENPLNECETPFVRTSFYKKIENPLNECETPFVRTSFYKKIENPLIESEKPFVPSSFYKNRKSH